MNNKTKIYTLLIVILSFSTSCTSNELNDNSKVDEEIIKVDETKDKEINNDKLDNESLAEENENIKENEYILPNSNTVLITTDDVKGLDQKEVRLAINEIYARRGRIFNNKEYQTYFENKSWYVGEVDSNNFDESIFNEYERANIEFLLSYEKSKKDENLNEPTKASVNIYNGTYIDHNNFVQKEENRSEYYYQIEIYNITDYTFDFSISKTSNLEDVEEVFKQNTAHFTGNGDSAICNYNGVEIKFSFPNERNSLPDVVQIKIDGLDTFSGIIFENNGVPGHEFN